ncbi:Nif3-like dinuclear metal center hexameric protein [Deinococcus sp.]|uniref:Nif3-like dinuclear metal center hexameric protein n=1 Tax=Deinococcus sp. TaxID=47478 RepID=UPI003C7B39DE
MTGSVGEFLGRMQQTLYPTFTPGPGGCDGLKAGDPDQPLSGVGVCFSASLELLRAAREEGLNLIVTHEPTYFSHDDATAHLQADPVYRAKRALIEEAGLVIYRLHDRPHAGPDDPFVRGLAAALGWPQPEGVPAPVCLDIPPTSLARLAGEVAGRLGADGLRWAGDGGQMVKRVVLSPGAAGGEAHRRLLVRWEPDALICGEVHEWETPEYRQDAAAAGQPLGLLVTGHAASELPGVQEVARGLEGAFPETRIVFLPMRAELRGGFSGGG